MENWNTTVTSAPKIPINRAKENPQLEASFSTWNQVSSLDDKIFALVPPPDSEKIEMVTEAQMKETAATEKESAPPKGTEMKSKSLVAVIVLGGRPHGRRWCSHLVWRRFNFMKRTNISISILVAALTLIPVTGKSPLGVEVPNHSHESQEPAPPPSPPSVTLTPDNLDFGDQVVRRTSPAKRIIVKNTGGQPLYFESVDLGGDNPNSFAILKDTCTGATIDPDKACIVEVTFTPLVTGGRNARLRLTDNALDSPQRLSLKGNGINSIDVAPF